MMNEIKVALDEGAKMPTKAYTRDAGFDLYSPVSRIIPAHSDVTIDTGVHVSIPEGTCGLLVSKSGLNVRHGITSTGLIDAGYTGSIAVKLYNHSNFPYTVNEGDKISQLVILILLTATLTQVDKLDESSERGNNGFGSSGR